MARQFPNNVAQAGVFYVGSPSYVDVDNTFTPVDERRTFAAAASAESWSDGDTFGVRISKTSDAEVYIICAGIWDAANERVEIGTLEESSGTLSNGESVTVSAVLTRGVLLDALFDQVNPSGNVAITGLLQRNAVLVQDITTARTISVADNGKILEFWSASPVTVTLPDNITGNLHCVIVQMGSGQVTIEVSGTATLNEGTSDYALPAQYAGVYVYQSTNSNWVHPV